MTTEIHNQINKAFSDFVEDSQAPELTEFFLKMAENSKFEEKTVTKSLKEYLQNMGADADMIKEMSEKAMEMLRDTIIPNKSTLYPSATPKKLKLSDMKKQTEKAEEKSEENAEAEAEPEKKVVTPIKKVTPAPKKAPSKKAAEEDEEESTPASASASAKKGGKKAPAKKAPAKAKAPTRASGHSLFYKEVKEEVMEFLEKDWKKKYANAPYTKNTTTVSREIGRRWEELNKNNKEKAEEYNARAAEENKKNNIQSRGKTKVSESDKRPLNGFSMFHKIKKDEVLANYRKEKNMAEDAKIKPTEAMTIISQAWAGYSKDAEKKAEMDRLAAEYNEEHGRKPAPKKEKSSDKKTNPYLLFCQNFREEYRAEHKTEDGELNVYQEASEMNKKWKTIKDDKEKHDAWILLAKEENIARGLIPEDGTEEEETAEE